MPAAPEAPPSPRSAQDTASSPARPDSPFDTQRADSNAAPPQGLIAKDQPARATPKVKDSGPAPMQQAAQLLGRRLQVVVKDGRTLEGDFHCLDKQGNMVLSNTHRLEHNGDAGGSGSSSDQQQMGLVLIPQQQRTSCHLLVMPGEERRMAELVREPVAAS